MGCYACLINGDATEKSLGHLLRAELSSAVTDAGIATTVVVVMLVAVGAAPVLVALGAVAAAVGTVLLHQLVLVAGVAIARWRASTTDPAHDPA